MYAFCFLKANTLLQPLATRALQTECQREEGVGQGVSPITRSSGKRKREKQETSIVGMDTLSSAFKPFSEEVARETEEAERDKARFEASEAKGRSAQSLLTAIAQAKQMEADAIDETEKKFMLRL